MPSLISRATGNFTNATTWALVDTVSFLDSEAGSTGLGTIYTESAAFTPGAITIDGIAVKLAARVASPTGTISVRLASAGALVPGTEVTINVVDLPTCSTTANEGGWILFKFAAPVTLAAATAYTVSAKCSVSGEAALWRNATAGNWSRMLRTTTTQAPAAGDILHIIGEHTGAGTGVNFVVTMNNTLTTDFGTGTDGSTCITVGRRGTLNYGFAAATNYHLRCSGNVIVYNGGTFTIGTVANPIPRDSTAVLEFDPVADGGMGLICRNGSTFIAQGLSRTLGKNIDRCKLNTDEAAGSTVLGVDTDTGWLVGDEIAIASTTRAYDQCERRILSAITATELTITTGLSFAHSGTAPTQAEIILLTRNVKIRTAVSTIISFVNFKPTATVDIDWVEFRWLGENVAPKRGVEIETTTGSCNIQYSSFHHFEDRGITIEGAAANNIIFSNNVAYNLAYTAPYCIFITTATPGTNLIFNNNILMYSFTAGNNGFRLLDIGGTFTNNTIVGMNGPGFYLTESDGTLGTFDGNIVHSCNDIGIYLYFKTFGVISNSTIWRNVGTGLCFRLADLVQHDIIVDTVTLFGNGVRNIGFEYSFNSETAMSIIFKNVISNGDTSFATTYGIRFFGAGVYGHLINIFLENCDFSTVSGIKTAHTEDISLHANINALTTMYLYNCKLGAPTEVAGIASQNRRSFVKSHKHNQITGFHKSWFRTGIITSDSVIRDGTTGFSQRLTPNKAAERLESGSKKVAVAAGSTVTVSVKVRESVAADGADYNGPRARLIVKSNPSVGIMADTVLATATVASEGAFETISGTTIAATEDGVMEFVVDCAGTTGWVNVDSWTTS